MQAEKIIYKELEWEEYTLGGLAGFDESWKSACLLFTSRGENVCSSAPVLTAI